MSEKIVGIVKSVSQFLIGSVVSETSEIVVLKNVAMLGISGSGAQTNIQFIPLDMLSLDPPFGIRNLLKNQAVELDVSVRKSDILFYVEDLSDMVVNNYTNFVMTAFPGARQGAPVVNPDQNIVKLFDTP